VPHGFTIHLAGDFSADQVECVEVYSHQVVPPAVAAAIESAWRDARSRLGEKIYDGPMARLESWRVEAGRLHLVLGRTGYKHFYGTNLFNPGLADQYGASVLANALGISVLVETADGHLILGRRGDGVAFHAHRVHPLGGTVEVGAVDCFAEIRRELAEEAGLSEEDLLELRCMGLAEDKAIRQPELMFYGRVRATLDRIKLDEAEHVGVWSVRAERAAVEKATLDAELTPIALAALRLWYDAAMS
jgi:NUDIX domain